MTISNSIMRSMSSIHNQINEATKTINRGGYENTTENLFHKLRNDNIQATKDIELKGIASAEEKYTHYDNILGEITTQLDSFKDLMINRINGGLSPEGITALKQEMESINGTIGTLINTKIGDTKLFDINTEMVIGDNMRVPRTFDRDFIQLNGVELTDVLQSITDSAVPDLDDFQDVFNLVEVRHTEIGARWNGLKSTKAIYENTKLSENEFMAKRYDLEGAIQNLNDLSLTYEALMKTVAKISALSLVHYV